MYIKRNQMGNGIYYNTLYVRIQKIDMLEMHRNIKTKTAMPSGRLLRCLKICIDSLLWIEDNSLFNLSTRIRARDTISEVKKILDKQSPTINGL